jgi:hypothetical protein
MPVLDTINYKSRYCSAQICHVEPGKDFSDHNIQAMESEYVFEMKNRNG